MKRNHFLQAIGVGALTPAFIPGLMQNDPKPQMDKKLVQDFVGISHRDKDKALAMLEEHPNLLNSAHDWGYGDFETALGSSGHVGYKELVLALIEKGAQTNIFIACLLGQINIVRLTLETWPHTLHAKGPHGFTLLHHAVEGGDDALEVKAYLESLGAKELKIPLY